MLKPQPLRLSSWGSCMLTVKQWGQLTEKPSHTPFQILPKQIKTTVNVQNKCEDGEFSGGPAVRTLRFYCCGCRFSPSVMSNCLQLHGLQHSRFPCPSPSPEVWLNSCPSSWWCHPTISSFVIPFSCLQSIPASRSFPMRRLFTSGGQSIGASALA